MANITAAEHPKLVLEMTAMERTTPAHYDEWNVSSSSMSFLTVQQLIIPSTEGRI